MRNVHVIGGAGGIGKWFIEKLLINSISVKDIYCYDINESALENLSSKIKTIYIKNISEYSKQNQNFHDNDWVIFAIPINRLEEIYFQLVSKCKVAELLFISLTSTQVDAMKILQKYNNSKYSFLGCHPLFGPSITSPVAKIIALVEFDSKKNHHQEFKKFLDSTGIITSSLTAIEHDKNMSVIQALTHFTYLSFADTLSKNKYNPRFLLDMSTPNFQFLYAFASRVIKIAPTTTGAIQYTTEAKHIRAVYLESVKRLKEDFDNCKNILESATVIEGLREPFSGNDVAEGYEQSEIAIDSVQRIENLLFRYKTQKRPFIFQHKESGKLHVIQIIEIMRDSVKYIESTKLVDIENKKYYAIGLHPQAIKNYKKIGINLPKPYTDTIKKRQIGFLQTHEIDEFYKSNILPAKMMVNIENYYPFGQYIENYYESWLPLLIEGLWNVKFIESYRRKGSIEKVTVEIEFNPEYKSDLIIKNINSVANDRLIENEEINKTIQRKILDRKKN